MAIGYLDQPDWILITQKVAIMFIIKNDHFRPFFGPDRPQGFPTWLPISIYTHKYMYIHTIVRKYTQIYVYNIRISHRYAYKHTNIRICIHIYV